MEINSPKLFIEINSSEYIFLVGDNNKQENFIPIYKCIVPISGFKNFKIIDFDIVFNTIKKNIYLIEQKLNFTCKDAILIINNFNCSFVNLSGFKKLNGSQILKENVTYILNLLKSNVVETEKKKIILHIFNTKYILDKKKIDNLPIGLFGDFYSHELSFCLMNRNDYKNLNNIFYKCNLKIEKILLKSFIEGSHISNENDALDTFFQIKINEDKSQIIYFENDALKLEQNFEFGSDLIIRDISKITSLQIETIRTILKNTKLSNNMSKEELVENHLFDNDNYIKIKKKLIFEIAEARIDEILEKLISKNINIKGLNLKNSTFLLNIKNQSHYIIFEDCYRQFFLKNNLVLKFTKKIETEDLMNSVYKLVHFGWKKEAIPVIQSKKSIIAKFFDAIFN